MAKTVLIVEDNELNMKLFHDLLEAHGYQTVGTRNGIEALDLARKHRPDLRILLTSGYVGELPVLADDRYPLIDKPFEREALAARLRELIDTRDPPPRARGGARSRQASTAAA